MSEYTLKERSLPVSDKWDVIVVGGGPAGCTAAAGAAREGAKVLLIEATYALGGMGTSGLVPAWCPFTDKERVIYGGLAEHVMKTCRAEMHHVDQDRDDWVPIDAERLKRIYDDLVTEHGVKVLFGSFLSGVECDESGGVDALIVANKAGLSVFKAPVYIDCTGDADLATWAGAAFEKGDETGEMQPTTHCVVLSNVDDYAFEHTLHALFNPPGKPGPVWDLAEDPEFPLIRDSHLCRSLVGPGTVGLNAGHLWNVDGTDPFCLSESVITGRKLAAQLRDGLAKHVPSVFGNAFLVNTGALMGVRETRRILGDYVLTVDDFFERRTFEDEICRNSYFIDIHPSTSEIDAEVRERRKAVSGRYTEREKYGKGDSHGIPYRCLTPKGVKNVLVAGRSISCERAVQGSVRVMPVCLAMGEAAGIAGAMAARDGGDVHAVDVSALRETLREKGAYLP